VDFGQAKILDAIFFMSIPTINTTVLNDYEPHIFKRLITLLEFEFSEYVVHAKP